MAELHSAPDQLQDPNASETIAAVDLGSNSFHLIVAHTPRGHVQVIDKIKEMVRLAEGLDDENRLVEEAMVRGIECLERFGQRLRNVPSGNVRVVGTNALRRARNGRTFIERAEEALGHPVEVISGREEARLIYLGVSHALEDNVERRLVVDIGGGSTEIILGRSFEPAITESLYMGCVSMSQSFFGDGKIKRSRLKAAELAALHELETIQEQFIRSGWDTVIGASGTIISILDIVTGQGWSKNGITLEALRRLADAAAKAGHVNRLALIGLSEERAPVFPGGLSVLAGVFKAFGIEQMKVSDGALREGLLYDLLGRFHHDDIRDNTVKEMMARYHVDTAQAFRVRDTARRLLMAVADAWRLDVEEAEPILGWAAMLHEIGLAIAHSQFHKHGSYLLQYMDMRGFSRNEQLRLALMVRAHRRKFPLEEFDILPEDQEPEVRLLTILLRVAVVLHRGRSDEPLPHFEVEAKEDALALRFQKGWLSRHALTRLDLEEEAAFSAPAGVVLSYSA
jgi:exopolyphosphatase/guanosine-5'-triphosphate,3'-diphosphate pyrophosphatase